MLSSSLAPRGLTSASGIFLYGAEAPATSASRRGKSDQRTKLVTLTHRPFRLNADMQVVIKDLGSDWCSIPLSETATIDPARGHVC
jgi:hypothetical protein